jgi:hypothetical protein
MNRRTFVLAAAGIAAARIARAQPAIEPKAVTYTGMGGKTYSRVPYVGRRVPLLLDPARKVEETIVGRALTPSTAAMTGIATHLAASQRGCSHTPTRDV